MKKLVSRQTMSSTKELLMQGNARLCEASSGSRAGSTARTMAHPFSYCAAKVTTESSGEKDDGSRG